MLSEKVYVSNVLIEGIAQQCNKTRYTTAMLYDWE